MKRDGSALGDVEDCSEIVGKITQIQASDFTAVVFSEHYDKETKL